LVQQRVINKIYLGKINIYTEYKGLGDCTLKNYTMGKIASFPKYYEYGYFGWPSVAKLEDGTLVAGVSGMRRNHLCIDGKVVLYYGSKDGDSWSVPRIIEDSQIDDRDTGIVCLRGNDILVSWFTGKHFRATWNLDDKTKKAVSFWSEDKFLEYNGSFVKISSDNGKIFSDKIRVGVTAPHGPVKLKDGTLMYMGNTFDRTRKHRMVEVISSSDGGYSWEHVGDVPYDVGITDKWYVEPHMIELPDSTLYGVIRDQSEYEKLGKVFRVLYTTSSDGGKKWSVPQPMGIDGSPPHLMMHSSGVLICSYGYRAYDFLENNDGKSGQRAVLSHDNGKTWSEPRIISDHIDNTDLGYPCTVELDDKSLFTVYYQQENPDCHPGLLYSKWDL
jgi:hypothetical protein